MSLTHGCVFCESKFPTKEELQVHFRKHGTGEIPILTAVQKSGRFTKKPVAKANDSSETTSVSSDVVSCDECAETFQTVSLAIQHKHKKHKKSTIKHYCIHCGMQFPLKYSLDKHVTTHPQVDLSSGCNFICLTCNFSFYTETALDYHKKSVHNRVTLDEKIETPPPSKKVKQMQGANYYQVYYCHLCGSEYVVKYNLERHLASHHTLEEREALPKELVKCEICEAIFFGKKAYDNHLAAHKDDDLIIHDPEEMAKLVRMDLDYDPSRVQSTVDRYLAKEANRSRKKPLTSDTPESDVKKPRLESDPASESNPSRAKGENTRQNSAKATGKKANKKK